MTIYRAAHRALVRDGRFHIRLTYVPAYDYDATVGDHTLIEFSPTVRLYYRASDDAIVWDVDGLELASGAITFSASQVLAIELEHTERRRRIRITGATTGDGVFDDVAGDPVIVETILFVLGPSTGVLEEDADLVELRPLDALTFAELAECRVLAQMDRDREDPDPLAQALINYLIVLSHEPAVFHDTCLMIDALFNVKYATGDLLEKIGSIVGLANEGWDDDTFRRYLLIHIDLLLSARRNDGQWTGTAPNIIKIVRDFITAAVGGSVDYTRTSAYNFSLSVPVVLTVPQAKLMLRFVRRAIYAGVLGYIQFPLSTDVWGSDSGPVANSGIWGSASVVVGSASIWDYVITTL